MLLMWKICVDKFCQRSKVSQCNCPHLFYRFFKSPVFSVHHFLLFLLGSALNCFCFLPHETLVTLVHHIHHVLKHKTDFFSLKYTSFQEIQTWNCVMHAALFPDLSSSKLSGYPHFVALLTMWFHPTFTIIIFITFCQCNTSYSNW